MLKHISRKIRVYFPLIARKTGRFRIDIKIRKNILLVDVQKLSKYSNVITFLLRTGIAWPAGNVIDFSYI